MWFPKCQPIPLRLDRFFTLVASVSKTLHLGAQAHHLGGGHNTF